MGRVDVETERLDDEDALAAADDYEQAIDDALGGYATCADDACRDPRRGPFVIDLGGDDGPVVYCVWCFATNVLRVDPDELGGM